MSFKSNKEFGYPVVEEDGSIVLSRVDGAYADMLQNTTVYLLKDKQEWIEYSETEEIAVILIEGSVEFIWNDNKVKAERKSFINDNGYCLHVPKGVKIIIRAFADSEIFVQSTVNDKNFDAKFYNSDNTKLETFGKDQFEGKAQRTVRTYFDYHSAPYSNFVVGEIIIPQGGWSSYPPHQHPQPEVYYYRFEHPNGFGACFIDDEVYKIQDRSFTAIPGGKYHPQVNAPGYAMFYIWSIRHFDDYPWTERLFDPDHEWLLNS